MRDPEIQKEIAAMMAFFRKEILQGKTRTVRLLGRKCEPQLLYTFLGFEVKLGPKRLTCPDMTTARYLRIFGKLGMPEIEIPYDPSKTAQVLPVLEESMEKIDRLLEAGELERLRRQRIIQRVYRNIRLLLQKLRSDPK
jgi:hypothetical protein